MLGSAWSTEGWSRVVDLGAGTGSNMRYWAPRLPPGQTWALVDHDASLLSRASAPVGVDVCEAVAGDLMTTGMRAIPDFHVVTASALLDLVSEDWMGRVVDECASHGVAAHFALSYNGRIDFVDAAGAGAHAEDDWVRSALNRHQQTDKGFGPALGPDAARVASRRFAQKGYRTFTAESPWILTHTDRQLALPLLEGWVGAVIEMHPEQSDRAREWSESRLVDLATGQIHIEVGHSDLLALPPAFRSNG
jgi:hypothetical protein